MGLFGDLSVRVDPWQAEFGSELALSEEEAAPEDVDLSVEVPEDAWGPIAPREAPLPRRLVFVDGVRRLEVRLVVLRGDRVCHGAFGSYGVGSVVIEDGMATLHTVETGRVAAVGSGEGLPEPVPVLPGLVYRPLSTAAADPDGPLQLIHGEMRRAEERLARSLADREKTLAVLDGPLTFGDAVRGGALGYVKRLFRLYVPDRHLGLLARLPAGARTPLLALRSPARFARYSWFLRLASPGPGDSELSGIVRLEVSETVGVEGAKRLADATAAALPPFTPGRARDPRSPQNLLPIGALEAHLRRRLGDASLIRRHIETLIAREAIHGS